MIVFINCKCDDEQTDTDSDEEDENTDNEGTDNLDFELTANDLEPHPMQDVAKPAFKK